MLSLSFHQSIITVCLLYWIESGINLHIWVLGGKQISGLPQSETMPLKLFSRHFRLQSLSLQKSFRLPFHIIKRVIVLNHFNPSSRLCNSSRPDRLRSMHPILSAYFPECQLNWTNGGNSGWLEEGRAWHKSPLQTLKLMITSVNQRWRGASGGFVQLCW